jgi:glucose-6-phosphate dehydrogenase assembly protein OpcA
MSSALICPAQPEKILKSLSKLWTSLAQQEKQEGKPTVLRACAMTLIVATDEADGGFSVSQIISELMREHPSRGIVLAISEQGSRVPEGRVLAQCWKPFGKAQQICCEQIEIRANREACPHMGPILNGLTVADLPVFLWCRVKDGLTNQEFGLEGILALATKVIVDTQVEDPKAAFAILEKWRSQGRLFADLEWTRLTRWREPLAQMFENSARQARLSDFHSIEIAHTGERPCASVLYLAGWLSSPYNATVSFVKTHGHGPGLHRVRLRSDSETIDLERTGAECATLRSHKSGERKYSLAEPNLYTVVNEELAVVGPDAAFNAAFARAQELLREQR